MNPCWSVVQPQLADHIIVARVCGVLSRASSVDKLPYKFVMAALCSVYVARPPVIAHKIEGLHLTHPSSAIRAYTAATNGKGCIRRLREGGGEGREVEGGNTYVPLRGHGPQAVQLNEDIFSTQYAVRSQLPLDIDGMWG